MIHIYTFMVRKLLVYTSVFCICITTVSAHSGKTNANGCHANSKTKEYHCHTPVKNINVIKHTMNTTKPTLKSAASNASTVTTPVIQCSKNIYNCTDFTSHAAAQKVYDYCIKTTGKDIHALDHDQDGLACETLR